MISLFLEISFVIFFSCVMDYMFRDMQCLNVIWTDRQKEKSSFNVC